MAHRYAEILFTNAVKSYQTLYDSRAKNQSLYENFGPNNQLTTKEMDFIAERDSFYLSTVGETGWPYVQHRGGPAGFLKIISPDRLAFADFKGNTQLISAGNVSNNDKCALILMDYSRQRRLKLLGHLRMHDAREGNAPDQELVSPENYRAKVERVAIIEVAAFDWNCPQHITPRYTVAEMADLAPADKS